jgi:hypothetical protein
MKQTQAIFLSFPTTTSTTTAYINIPFVVKTIHIKSMNYQNDNQQQTAYALLQSNLGLNSPLGIINLDNTYSSSSIQDIEIQLKNPQVLQGQYEFSLKYMDNTPFTSTDTAYICMIVEFNAEDEIN